MFLILNDVSGGEILLVLAFVLIFFGSKSIPGLARTLGRTMRQIRDASNEIQSEIRKSGNEMKNDLNLKGIIEETAQDIKKPLDQYAQDIEEAVELKPKTSRPRPVQVARKPENTDPESEEPREPKSE